MTRETSPLQSLRPSRYVVPGRHVAEAGVVPRYRARWRPAVIWFVLAVTGLWLVSSPVWAGRVVRESAESLVRQADFVFVAEVTKHTNWSTECEGGLDLEVRSVEILKGSAKKKFEDFPYRIWWPTSGPDCPSVSFVEPPRALDLGVGQEVIALVGAGYSGTTESVSATFGLESRAEIEGWIRGKKKAK